MKFKILLISLFLLLEGCANSIIKKDKSSYLPIIDDSESSYFYIDNLSIEKAKNADSITYFYTDSEPNDKLIQYFKEFSKQIGNKHGAVIISPNTNVKRAYKLVNEISSCEKIEPTLWPVIVFEDRTVKQCYPLYIQEVKYSSLIGVLDIVKQMMVDSQHREKLQKIHNTKDRVSTFIKVHPSLKVIEGVLYMLVDLLGEKLI